MIEISIFDVEESRLNLRIGVLQKMRKEDFDHVEDCDRRIFDLKKSLRLLREAKAEADFVYYCRHGRFPV